MRVTRKTLKDHARAKVRETDLQVLLCHRLELLLKPLLQAHRLLSQHTSLEPLGQLVGPEADVNQDESKVKEEDVPFLDEPRTKTNVRNRTVCERRCESVTSGGPLRKDKMKEIGKIQKGKQ